MVEVYNMFISKMEAEQNVKYNLFSKPDIKHFLIFNFTFSVLQLKWSLILKSFLKR